MNRDYIFLNTPTDKDIAQVAIPQAEQAAAMLSKTGYKPTQQDQFRINSVMLNLNKVLERGDHA